MDFSDRLQACLDGRWRAFDAGRSVPWIGRIVMACSLDAALSMAFGAAPLRPFEVTTCEEAEAL